MRSSKDFYMTIVGSALEDSKVKCKSRGTEDAIYHQQIEILSSPGISWTIHFSAELFSTAQAQALFPSTILGKKTHILA
jgi:hypothetical protein